MSRHLNRRITLLVMTSLISGAVLADDPKGSFGFVAKVDADGVFNPILKTVHIQSVQSGMPAALAGIVAGDSILEVEGIKVAGSKASVMADRMKKKPGESVLLKLVRANGETYVATLVAVAPKH